MFLVKLRCKNLGGFCMKKIMAVNAGSSTLKFKLFEMPTGKILTSGIAERIGQDMGRFTIADKQGVKHSIDIKLEDHAKAVDLLLNGLIQHGILKDLSEINGIGHRIVQGGKYFNDSHIVDEETENIIEQLIPLAPLHNAAHLVGIRAFKQALPNCPNVAVFDTAFHTTMDLCEKLYPIPYEDSIKYDIYKYGAHGTSHKYLSQVAISIYLNNRKDTRIISMHIGSGCSLCAIKDGKCIDTSMGLTPLAGVMMSTRTGDIDPSIMTYYMKRSGKSAEEIYDIYNKKSGLLGVSGISLDTRDLEKGMEEGNERAKLATDMFISRIAKYVGSYFVELGHVDMLIFSAGVFENSSLYRKLLVDYLKEPLGLELDEKLNEETIKGKGGLISTKNSKIPMAVIPTDEELMIALDTLRIANL